MLVFPAVFTLLAGLVHLGFVDRFSVRKVSTLDTSQQVRAPVRDVEEQMIATSDSRLGTSSAAEAVAGPNDDPVEAAGSSLPADPQRILVSRHSAEVAEIWPGSPWSAFRRRW